MKQYRYAMLLLLISSMTYTDDTSDIVGPTILGATIGGIAGGGKGAGIGAGVGLGTGLLINSSKKKTQDTNYYKEAENNEDYDDNEDTKEENKTLKEENTQLKKRIKRLERNSK